MRRFTASRVRSFVHAFGGWWYVLRTQRNAWLEVAIALVVCGVAFWLRLGPVQWAVIVLTVAIVFSAELFNTAIEVVVDLASPQQQPLAGIAKDVAAASVLVAAFGAVVIGILLLGPPLLIKLQGMLAP